MKSALVKPDSAGRLNRPWRRRRRRSRGGHVRGRCRSRVASAAPELQPVGVRVISHSSVEDVTPNPERSWFAIPTPYLQELQSKPAVGAQLTRTAVCCLTRTSSNPSRHNTTPIATASARVSHPTGQSPNGVVGVGDDPGGDIAQCCVELLGGLHQHGERPIRAAVVAFHQDALRRRDHVVGLQCGEQLCLPGAIRPGRPPRARRTAPRSPPHRRRTLPLRRSRGSASREWCWW